MAKRDTRRDSAGVGPEPDRSRRRLVSIDDLDGFQVAEGEPDIRGWEVCTLNGRELGSVEDLLIDPERGEVVMLEVAMRGDVHAEVPLRSVQIDRKRKVIVADSGDVDEHDRHDVRARDRMTADERDEIRGAYRDRKRDLRYGDPDADAARDIREDAGVRSSADARTDDSMEEHVIERRPMVEEVVVRRRVANDGDQVINGDDEPVT
jgi:sporulation protein YlmC with PRC-barrel domain